MSEESPLVTLVIGFSLLSLMAVGGGSAVLPEMHRMIVETHGWMDDAAFARSYALAQAAPGPNILVVGLFGWHVAGAWGMVLTTLAMCGPSSILALLFAMMRAKLLGARWLRVAERGMVPVALGLVTASGLLLGQSATAGWGASAWVSVLITAGSTAFVFSTRHSPVWVLGIGAALGFFLFG